MGEASVCWKVFGSVGLLDCLRNGVLRCKAGGFSACSAISLFMLECWVVCHLGCRSVNLLVCWSLGLSVWRLDGRGVMLWVCSVQVIVLSAYLVADQPICQSSGQEEKERDKFKPGYDIERGTVGMSSILFVSLLGCRLSNRILVGHFVKIWVC